MASPKKISNFYEKSPINREKIINFLKKIPPLTCAPHFRFFDEFSIFCYQNIGNISSIFPIFLPIDNWWSISFRPPPIFLDFFHHCVLANMWHMEVNTLSKNLRINIFITNQLINFNIKICKEKHNHLGEKCQPPFLSIKFISIFYSFTFKKIW